MSRKSEREEVIESVYLIALIVAVLLVVWGVMELLAGNILLGVILLVLACLVGPGGYSVLRRNRSRL